MLCEIVHSLTVNIHKLLITFLYISLDNNYPLTFIFTTVLTKCLYLHMYKVDL